MKIKKVIIAAAIVCAAAYGQAASIAWGSGAGANFVDENGIVQTSSTAPAGTFVLVFLGNGTADWSSAIVVQEANVTYKSVKGANTATLSDLSYSWEYGKADTPVNGDIFGVMFKDGDGKLSQVVDYASGDPIEKTVTVSGMENTLWATTYSFTSGNFTTSVPEPTSGILILLGMGALALRRKQK